MSKSEKRRCQCLTEKNIECKRSAKPGSDYCFQHQDCPTPIKGPLRPPSPEKPISPKRVQVFSERSVPSPKTPSPMTPSRAKLAPLKPVLKKPEVLSPRREVGTISRISPPKTVSTEKRIVPAAPLPKRHYGRLTKNNLDLLNRFYGDLLREPGQSVEADMLNWTDKDEVALNKPQADLKRIRILNPVAINFEANESLPKIDYDKFIILENPEGIAPIDILNALFQEFTRVNQELGSDESNEPALLFTLFQKLVPHEDDEGPYYSVVTSSWT